MHTTMTPDAAARALADQITAAWGARIGGVALSAEAAGRASGPGWSVRLPIRGTVNGVLTIWFERDAVVASQSQAQPADETAAGLAAVDALRNVTADAMRRLAEGPHWTGTTVDNIEIQAGEAPAAGTTRDLTIAGLPPLRVVVTAEIGAAALSGAGSDVRLEAVLDVEMPLVVRFGRTVMPLRTLAELGPGSVIDMNRSPDEPVELLVGERLIARGEVVVVGGNYGVRITELASGRSTGSEFDVRTS